MTHNTVIIAAAGSGKTHHIVNKCDLNSRKTGKGALILTLTTESQRDVQRRVLRDVTDPDRVEILGWYSFLLRHWIKPYLPDLFPDRVARGFHLDGEPPEYAKGEARYFNRHSEVYGSYVAKLAHEIAAAGTGETLDRLSRIYSHVFIDEVQDLVGWDLEILDLMIGSPIRLTLVGDVRQALISTNHRTAKNKKYRGVGMLKWLAERADALERKDLASSRRCRQEILDLADSIFAGAGFEPTTSLNLRGTAHDGLFWVRPENSAEYVRAFDPLVLRATASTKAPEGVSPVNIGKCKGLESDHVLVVPTDAMRKFLGGGDALEGIAACRLYVALTRARQSVAFVMRTAPATGDLKEWTPGT